MCCAFVGLDNKLYKMQGTYIKTTERQAPANVEFALRLEREYEFPFEGPTKTALCLAFSINCCLVCTGGHFNRVSGNRKMQKLPQSVSHDSTTVHHTTRISFNYLNIMINQKYTYITPLPAGLSLKKKQSVNAVQGNNRCFSPKSIQNTNTLCGENECFHVRPSVTGQLICDGTRAETRFLLSAKRMSPFKSAGASVQSATGSRGVSISGSIAGYTMFRGSVKGTGYPLHSPVSLHFPSRASPCVIVFQLESTYSNHRTMKG